MKTRTTTKKRIHVQKSKIPKANKAQLRVTLACLGIFEKVQDESQSGQTSEKFKAARSINTRSLFITPAYLPAKALQRGMVKHR